MTLWRRLVLEHRAIVLPVAILAVANVAAYFFVVRPAQARAASVVARAAAAAELRRQAEEDEAAARALVSGKAHAEEELATFYDQVLPEGAAAARRLTYARLPALARDTRVRYEERQSSFDVSTAEETGLGRLDSRMLLQGDYADIRTFLYELETSPEFVLIDAVTIVESQAGEQQSLTIQLSTYFRVDANGA